MYCEHLDEMTRQKYPALFFLLSGSSAGRNESGWSIPYYFAVDHFNSYHLISEKLYAFNRLDVLLFICHSGNNIAPCKLRKDVLRDLIKGPDNPTMQG